MYARLAVADVVHLECKRAAGEYHGTLHGRVTLDRLFLDGARSEDAQVTDAIRHQIRYLWGWYRNDAVTHAGVQMVLSAEPARVEFEKHEGRYGRALSLAYPTTEARLQIEDSYTRRAAARGETRWDDPALIVDYTATVTLAVCGRGTDPGRELTGPVPRDPWLAYWLVPAERHRLLSYFGDSAVTNPCADDDFADLPHPFYYWYDWLPTRHGLDAAGKPFDCRRWLTPHGDFDTVTMHLAPVRQTGGPPSLWPSSDLGVVADAFGDGVVTMTLVFGILDHDAKDPGRIDLAGWQALVGAGGAGVLAPHVKAARAAWKARPKHERGTGMLLQFLDELVEVAEVTGHDSALEADLLRVTVRGRLRRSGRPMRLQIFLGMTDIFGPKPPHHWAALRRGLVEDQAVFYWGHSGIGENVRLGQIASHLQIDEKTLAADIKKGPLRVVAFQSCYSYMYFGQDFQDLVGPDPRRLFVFTGTAPVRVDHGPLPLVAFVDDLLTDRRAPTHLRWVGDDEFWILKQ